MIYKKVVYDPLDINKLLYDVDNGTYHSIPKAKSLTYHLTEATVITLADWYHSPAPQQQLPAFVFLISTIFK
jgi:hypothetical protein